MKKLFVALMLMPLMAFADTETVDGIEWTYTISDGQAQIGTGNHMSRAIPVATTGEITIPSILGGKPVTIIADYAFYNCSGLTSMTIPSCVTRIGAYAFVNCGLREVHVSDLSSFGRIDFADYSSNPVLSNTKLYANGNLVEETIKVTFKLADNWVGAFREIVHEEASMHEEYVGEKIIEVVKGHPAFPPEVTMWDKRFEICAWDVDLCCMMSDVVARPIYGGADINEALRSCISPYGAWIDDSEIIKELNDSCFVDRLVFDAASGCIRAQGTMNTESSPLCDLDDTYQYGALDERLYENLRIRLIGRDERGDRVCHLDLPRFYSISGYGFAWSGALPIDTNRVRRIDVALASTWYREECCFKSIAIGDIESRMLAVRKIDIADLDDAADYEFMGKRTENHYYSYSKRRENTVTYCDYKRVVESEKCEAIYEFSDREGRCNPYDIRSSGIVSLNGMNIDLSGGSFSWITDYDSLSCVTNVVRLQVQREWTDKSDWQVDRFSWEEHAYSTFFVVAPQKYSVRFDLAECGDRVGGGELVQEIDSGKGESEELPIVEAYPHCTFLRWAKPYWEGTTLVYIAEYDREYVITYQDVKGLANSNPSTYTTTNEVVFAPLADTDEYWFKGWEPTRIKVGTTGDLVVTAKWERVQSIAEVVGDSALEWKTSGDADWFVSWNEEKNKYVVRSGELGNNATSRLDVTVRGSGEVSFWWKASTGVCRGHPMDFGVLVVDGRDVADIYGEADWTKESVVLSGGGMHTVRWEFRKDEMDDPESVGDDCIWLDEVVWTPVKPTIEGDPGATVTGDAETGFVIKPSVGKTAVEVTILQGVDAAKVTVEVSVKVETVKPNGAKVKIVSGAADITEFLNVPVADGNGVVDLTKATVKEEIVKETLDVEKGAVIDLGGGSQGTASPTITTAPTRVGLFYQLREGETLGGMVDGDSKVGDGEPWTPEIKVKGGKSAFYSIGVGKGE